MSEPKTDACPGLTHVLVDGFNVLHALLLTSERRAAHGTSTHDPKTVAEVCWWLPEFQRRVVTWAEKQVASRAFQAVAQTEGPARLRVSVVFDASREVNERERVSSEVVSVVYAPNADDWIVDVCEREVALVVTADRALSDRAYHRGARRIKPWQVDDDAAPRLQ